MHRSSSWTRTPDEDYMHAPPMASNILRTGSFQGSDHEYELPAYDPISDMTRKDKPRAKFAENAVHVIPFVLLLCAIILWLFSGTDAEGGITRDIAARIEGMTIEGDFDTDIDGTTQTGLLPLLDSGDDETLKRSGVTKHSRRSKKRSF